jgi:peptide-methionine (S)-S-oxide reductase
MIRHLSLYLAAAAAALLPFQAPAQGKPEAGLATAIFAGGCFWCMEPPFDELPGVVSTTSGYIGGHTKNPTYPQVSAGTTGHTEAVQVRFDPKKVSYAKLLEVFWRNIDPATPNAQFCDHGSQYRSGIFFLNEEQQRQAVASREQVERTKSFREPIVTEITRATTFYAAEDYHQDYYKKNALRYKFYRYNCGRDARLEQLWGKSGH